VVRVPWNDQPSIMRALDFGAAGVIVPMISTPQEARFAADAVRYPPHGVRSFGPTRGYYADDPNRIEPACLVMIETKAGLENIAAIAATPGVDGLFVGAADLGLDLGLSLSLKPTPPILAAIDRMIAVCNERGITPGAAGMDTKSSEDFLKRGVRFLTLSSDIGYMRRAMQEDVDTFKSWRNPG
jgi:4-hydroxy-2-oxoheptanedioate aldolase